MDWDVVAVHSMDVQHAEQIIIVIQMVAVCVRNQMYYNLFLAYVSARLVKTILYLQFRLNLLLLPQTKP